MSRPLAIALLCLFVLSACKNKTTVVEESEPIARVDGVEITVGDFVKLFETLKPREHSLSGAERAKIKNLVIKTLIRRRIILNTAKEMKVSVQPEEVEQALKEFKADHPSSVFEESLLDRMVEEEEWKNQVTQTLLMEKLFASKELKIEAPTTKDALVYYQNHPEEFKRPAECSARHLVVEDEELAKKLRKKIKRDPRQFLPLAKEYSIGPEAKEKAIITVEKGVMPDPIDRFLFQKKAKRGDLSHVLKTIYGYHILEVRRCSPVVNFSFEQAKKDILQRLADEKRQAALSRFEEGLIRAAEVEYNRRLILSL